MTTARSSRLCRASDEVYRDRGAMRLAPNRGALAADGLYIRPPIDVEVLWTGRVEAYTAESSGSVSGWLGGKPLDLRMRRRGGLEISCGGHSSSGRFWLYMCCPAVRPVIPPPDVPDQNRRSRR